MRTLTTHDWPGNLRELRRMLTQSLLLFRGSVLRAEDVRRAIDGKLWREETAIGTATAEMLGQCVRDFVGRFGGDGCHERLIEAVEREALREALRRGGGSQTRAAGVLGIPRPTLHAKLERRGVRSNGAPPPVSR
jgi:two-component system nitrogen regulation response regulator GlnG